GRIPITGSRPTPPRKFTPLEVVACNPVRLKLSFAGWAAVHDGATIAAGVAAPAGQLIGESETEPGVGPAPIPRVRASKNAEPASRSRSTRPVRLLAPGCPVSASARETSACGSAARAWL